MCYQQGHFHKFWGACKKLKKTGKTGNCERMLNPICDQELLAGQELLELLMKRPIHKAPHAQRQFLRRVLLNKKKDRGHSFVINLNEFNKFFSHKPFKMEGWNYCNFFMQKTIFCSRQTLNLTVRTDL